jgi:hypothetical protein
VRRHGREIQILNDAGGLSKTQMDLGAAQWLDEEEGGVARKSSLSDAVLDLAERLAARLQDEADARVANIVAEYADRESGRASIENQLKQELADAKARAKQLETDIHAETEAHAATRQAQSDQIEPKGCQTGGGSVACQVGRLRGPTTVARAGGEAGANSGS